ncbi:MAG: hypothetical protein AAGD01_10750 [Acidobacteriota bacterium]
MDEGVPDRSKRHLELFLALQALLAATALPITVVVLLTELTSNTAAAFLPVLASVAAALGRDPLVFLLPATLAAS